MFILDTHLECLIDTRHEVRAFKLGVLAENALLNTVAILGGLSKPQWHHALAEHNGTRETTTLSGQIWCQKKCACRLFRSKTT